MAKIIEKRAMKTYLIKDTLEVYYKPHDNCIAPYFIGLTTEGNISRETNVEKIYAGLNRKVIAISEIDEGMEIAVETGLYYADMMELKFGKPAREGGTEIHNIVVNEDGTFEDELEEVQGHIIDLEAGSFAKNGLLQLHTYAYDAEDGDKIVADIYWIFPNVKPNSDFEQLYTMGDNATQTVDFTPQILRDQDSYGQYVVIPRELDGEDGEECIPAGSEEAETKSVKPAKTSKVDEK